MKKIISKTVEEFINSTPLERIRWFEIPEGEEFAGCLEDPDNYDIVISDPENLPANDIFRDAIKQNQDDRECSKAGYYTVSFERFSLLESIFSYCDSDHFNDTYLLELSVKHYNSRASKETLNIWTQSWGDRIREDNPIYIEGVYIHSSNGYYNDHVDWMKQVMTILNDNLTQHLLLPETIQWIQRAYSEVYDYHTLQNDDFDVNNYDDMRFAEVYRPYWEQSV